MVKLQYFYRALYTGIKCCSKVQITWADVFSYFPPLVLVNVSVCLWEREKFGYMLSYHLSHRYFTMTMKTNPAYTHFCFLSDSACVRESLPLSSLYKDLISASVEYVNPSVGPPAFSLYPRDPHCPTLPTQVGERGSGTLQQRLGGPGLHPLVDYVWWREEGEGEVQDVILLTIPVPYGERTGFSSGTVSGVAGTACLSNQGVFFLKLTVSCSHVGSLV